MAIPPKLKQMIGKSSKPATYDIEKGQLRRFARAIEDEDAIHVDEKAAKAAGFESLVAPPTFPAALHSVDALLEDLGIDPRSTMHAEEEYEYFRAIVAGDELVVTHKVVNAYDKQAPNGRLIFVVLETRGNDKRGKPVFKGRRVLVELKT
jgi:acyl dehydratase